MPEYYGLALDASCLRAAAESVADYQKDGKSRHEVEVRYQEDLAVCSSVEASMAAFVGTVNVDYARLGRLFLNGRLEPNAYLARVRDRSRKLRACQHDPTWISEFAAGDDDGDLVPNSRDSCPGTEDLSPTDDLGCPSVALPEAPSARDVRRAIDAMGLVLSPACDGAPLPPIVEPIKTGYDNVDRSDFCIAILKVNNQPPDCVVFYEISIRLSGSSPAAPVPAKSLVHIVFRSSENTDLSSTGQVRQVFRTNISDGGERRRLFDVAKYYGRKDIRVRVMNGNGLSMGWSSTLSETSPSFGEP